MHVLPEAFSLATSIGLWEPLHWKSRFAKILYKMYTCLTFATIVLLMITQIIAALFFMKNVDDFAEATYILLSTINASVKGGTILLRRRNVIDLTQMLLEKKCVPRNDKEEEIRLYFDKMSRYTVISCIVLAEATVSCLIAWPIVFARNEYVLPLRAWHPYDAGSGFAYWLTYFHQGIALLLIAAYDVANDTVITGFMIHTCVQLELMTCRLQELTMKVSVAKYKQVPKDVIRLFEKNVIAQSVQHHIFIFRFADYINSIFAPVILIQYCLSSLILCVTVYQLAAKKSNGIEVVFLIFYLMSMLVEFFIYCWFGNEVTLKSLAFTTAICEMDWSVAHVKTLKELLIMIIRSFSPILLSCGPLITLSLESFTSILKISYSAFNVLQRSD